ncbi:hypothetical protein QUF65_13740 [Lysinibacillus sphaericus]|uniref:hypothetical protein n=1 Tax=Lysinibacillus sphaericus TaxID=1421 RepID=UPI0025A27256|nr:hypothetical protein [Lysinibacillus sphaericus]MDM5351948.1 hypothetical protein [Lysinibacillus sphaericus]
MNRDFHEDLKNGKYNKRDNIADIIPYSLEGIPYGLPINASTELRKNMAAAIFKHITPEEDFECIVTKLDLMELSDKNNVEIHDVITYTISNSVEMAAFILNDLFELLGKNHYKITFGESLFQVSLIRLKESFKSAVIMLRYGFFVEVILIYRLIYEQLCWACFVIDEKCEKEIMNNKTTKNTKYLKAKINKEYGKLYDYLSKEAHLAPKEISKYILLKGEELSILERSGEECKKETGNLILLYKIYIEVFKYSVNKHFTLDESDKSYYNDFLNSQLRQCSILTESLDKNDISFSIEKKI